MIIKNALFSLSVVVTRVRERPNTKEEGGDEEGSAVRIAPQIGSRLRFRSFEKLRFCEWKLLLEKSHTRFSFSQRSSFSCSCDAHTSPPCRPLAPLAPLPPLPPLPVPPLAGAVVVRRDRLAQRTFASRYCSPSARNSFYPPLAHAHFAHAPFSIATLLCLDQGPDGGGIDSQWYQPNRRSSWHRTTSLFHQRKREHYTTTI
jgi:hypothetical protein